ncbi:hypothetical protein OAQ62_01945 [bacterium]|nr:hypothetical protein [bacterium]
MKLLVNGCSFSAGSSMQGSVPWLWPEVISENFSEVQNISKAGGSNDRILRTTMDFCKKNMEDYFVIIQWTSAFRHEYYSNQYGWMNITCNVGDNNLTQLTNESNKHNNTIEVTDENDNIIENKFLLDALNKEMLYLTSINDYNIRYLKNVLTLQYYLDKNNIKYMFTSMNEQEHINVNLDAIYSKPTDVTIFEANLKKQLNKTNWSKQSLQTYMVENYISQNDRHPNEKGNKLIAQALFEELMEKHG